MVRNGAMNYPTRTLGDDETVSPGNRANVHERKDSLRLEQLHPASL
jgi:hypothetical protein